MHKCHLIICSTLLMNVLTAKAARAAEYVWWEAETQVLTNFPKQTAFSADNYPQGRNVLSNRSWLTFTGAIPKGGAYAKWRVEVSSGGEFNLWCRKFWKHGPFQWHLDGSDFSICPSDVGLADESVLAPNVVANWVSLGKVTLTKGPHTFELHLLGNEGDKATAAFDCFLLIKGAFIPRGKFLPDQKTKLADPGFFAWEPSADPFTDCAIDLRGMNEKLAGESGWLTHKGSKITLANGTPARLFAVNLNENNIQQSHESMDYMARKLAKLGVNAVRFHSRIFDLGADPNGAAPANLDNLHYLVSALKKNGIYTELSLYYVAWFDATQINGIEGYSNDQRTPFAILYFNPKLQALYRAWMKRVFTETNPYTHIALGGDPAVGIIECVNEDSLFFWTFNKKLVPEAQWKLLEKMYGGTIEDAWHMTADGIKQGGEEKRQRMIKQVKFLAKLQRDFYASTVEMLRKECGFQGLVTASNWVVSDPSVLDAVERWTYLPAGTMDHHGYFSGKHEGEGNGWSVRVGHTFSSVSVLNHPDQLPIRVVTVADAPQIVTEIGFTAPNRYRADGTLVSTAYAALQGIDGLFFFNLASNYLQDNSMEKFSYGSPVGIATFPATALMYRRGDVQEGPVVAMDPIGEQELFSLNRHFGVVQALDENRKKDVTAKVNAGELDPLAFFVGKVERSYSSADAQPKLLRTNTANSVITSATRELNWQYARGVLTVDTPRTQAAAGFLKSAGTLKLKDVSIDTLNDYLTVIVTSLDAQPIAQSKKLLIQAMTEDRPHGFKTDGDKITDLGGAPFNIRKISAKVTLNWPSLKAYALDENGYAAKRDVLVTNPGGSTVIELPEDGVYTYIAR